MALRLKQNTPEHIVTTRQPGPSSKGIQTNQTLVGFIGTNGAYFQNQMPLGISLFNVTTPFQIFVNQLKSFPGLIKAWTTRGQFDIVSLWQARTSDEVVKSAFEKFPYSTRHRTQRDISLPPHHSSNNKRTISSKTNLPFLSFHADDGLPIVNKLATSS